jgi:hypothetical protein
VNTIGRLYTPSRLLGSAKSPSQVVLKKAAAAVPFVEDALLANVASDAVIAA